MADSGTRFAPSAPAVGAATAAIERSLAAMAPLGTATGCRRIDARDVAALHPVEWASIAASAPKRQHEFASGRVLLHRLLGGDVAIPIGDDRRPVLPAGLCATIAHDDEWTVAAAARTDTGVIAMGIDVEPATALGADLAGMVLRPDEPDLDAHLAFTLKEATYKAWSCLGGPLLEHHDLRLADVDSAHFRAEVVGTGAWFRGRHTVVEGRYVAITVATVSRIPRPGRAGAAA